MSLISDSLVIDPQKTKHKLGKFKENSYIPFPNIKVRTNWERKTYLGHHWWLFMRTSFLENRNYKMFSVHTSLCDAPVSDNDDGGVHDNLPGMVVIGRQIKMKTSTHVRFTLHVAI